MSTAGQYTQSEEDATEVYRMSIQHQVIRKVMRNQLIVAPLDLSRSGLRVLDSATNDGLWLRDVKSTMGNDDVIYIGTDINEGFFLKETLPQITLIKHNITEPYPQEWLASFDLVHQRFTLPAAIGHPVKSVVLSLAGLVKPGGWIQLIELDFNRQPVTGSVFARIFTIFKTMLEETGVGWVFTEKLSEWLKEADFEEVQEHDLIIPIGKSCQDPEIAGKAVESMILTAEAMAINSKRLPYIPGVSVEQIASLPIDLKKELDSVGGSWKSLIVVGQRPLE